MKQGYTVLKKKHSLNMLLCHALEKKRDNFCRW